MYRPAFLAALATAALVGAALPGTGAAGGVRVDERPTAAAAESAPDHDDLVVAATKDVPGFGGAYVDEKTGAAHVWMTQPATESAARARGALATRLGFAATGTDTVVHRATYSFAQLKTWHDGMVDVLALPGVTMTDIDERTNRLLVGVEDTARAASPVSARLAKLGVPRAAVTLVGTSGFRPTLRDRTRPLTAGTQIQDEATLPICTMGFIAIHSAGVGFVTNSHCSITRGAVDSGRYWQAVRPTGDGDVVGNETVDPPMFTGGSCPTGKICRRSDANFVASRSGLRLGGVARPPLGSTNWNGTDLFNVTSTGRVTSGTVQKVGRTTGLTSGTVNNVCMNLNVTGGNITMLCQDTATYGADSGDSGSPVFAVTNSPAVNDVRAVGIHWGTGTINGQRIGAYSPFEQITAELGRIRVCGLGGSGC